MGRSDLAFVSGRVFLPTSMPPATAVLVANGRIAAVGGDRDVKDLIDSKTEVVDLGGRLLLPGFQDAHIHPATAGLELTRCALYDTTNALEAAQAITAYAIAHPDEPWILGGGWAMDWYPGGTPTVEELDRLVPDRPVYLRNRDGHGAWVNTAALAAAGIGAATGDPASGRIERRPDGSPQGTLQEGAMGLMDHVVPQVTPADYASGLEAALDYLIPLGITAWQDAAVDPTVHTAYRLLAESGRLPVDVVGALWWDRERGFDQIDDLVQLRTEGIGGYRPTSVKIMLDGVAENFTAAMLDPYLDASGTPTDNSGLDFVERGVLLEAVTRLAALGFQVHFHALGDRAVRHALDAIEAARSANGPSDLRHHLAHIQLIHPTDIPRFAALGAVPNAQPFWACADPYQIDLTMPFLGPERSILQYPFASLLRAGATMAMGSDWSVSTPNPLLEIEVAVTRVMPDSRHDEALGSHERISLAEALTAFTAGSAFVNHRDDSGSIAVGQHADLVIVDRDLFDSRTGPVGEASVDMTIIGGEVMYRREAAV